MSKEVDPSEPKVEQKVEAPSQDSLPESLGTKSVPEPLPIPKFEEELAENTPESPEPKAFIVLNPNVRSSYLVGNVMPPSGISKLPLPKEEFVDRESFSDTKLKDEYKQTVFDPKGEKKISKNGVFKDLKLQQRILLTTFTLPGKGKRLYCMANDASKELQFKDSNLFFSKNPSLYKFTTSDVDKAFLIKNGILPAIFKSRSIGVITFRSLYLIYGARLLKDGVRVEEDYWEELATEQGFTKESPVFVTPEEELFDENGNPIQKTGPGKKKKRDLDFDFKAKADLHDLSKRVYMNSPTLKESTLADAATGSNPNLGDSNGEESRSSILSGRVSQLMSIAPLPVSIPHHPFITNTKYKKFKKYDYKLNYSQVEYLNNLLIQEPNDEQKENYLLSSGITHSLVLNKPLRKVNLAGQLIGQTAPAPITSPGGSTPSSITSSLLNNENLITANGDNIYYISCLPVSGISGYIDLSKNLLTFNYKMLLNDNKTDRTKLEELLSSLPLTNDNELIGVKNHMGLKFYHMGNILKKLIALQKSDEATPREQLVKAKDGKGYELVGEKPPIAKIRNLEYSHNAVSVNQNINNFAKLRSSQWKYFWFDKTGGYKMVRKNLKRKILREEPPDKMKICRGDYFNYYIIPKGKSLTSAEKLEIANKKLVKIDLNEDSDEELIEEHDAPLPPHYHLTQQATMKLTRKRDDLVEKFKESRANEDKVADLFKLEFQTMLKTRTIKKRKLNTNAI